MISTKHLRLKHLNLIIASALFLIFCISIFLIFIYIKGSYNAESIYVNFKSKNNEMLDGIFLYRTSLKDKIIKIQMVKNNVSIEKAYVKNLLIFSSSELFDKIEYIEIKIGINTYKFDKYSFFKNWYNINYSKKGIKQLGRYSIFKSPAFVNNKKISVIKTFKNVINWKGDTYILTKVLFLLFKYQVLTAVLISIFLYVFFPLYIFKYIGIGTIKLLKFIKNYLMGVAENKKVFDFTIAFSILLLIGVYLLLIVLKLFGYNLIF